jgi:transcription antitermination protein NusB
MAGSSSRSKARKRALDILFEAELRGTDTVATLEERAAAAKPPVREYTAELVRGVTAHAAEIDARISACLAPGWTLPRIPRVDRNVLRIAVYEIDYGDVPDAVAVAEAVQLVSDLSTEESPSFVNGVLRAISTSAVG